MKTRMPLPMLAATFLAGCASVILPPPPPPLSQADQAELLTPLLCHGADECSLMWKRAQVFVATNSGYKIQTANDVVIETYGAPESSSRYYALSAVREPKQAAGEEQIKVGASCGHMGLCGEGKPQIMLRFKRYIKSGA